MLSDVLEYFELFHHFLAEFLAEADPDRFVDVEYFADIIVEVGPFSKAK